MASQNTAGSNNSI